VEGHRRVHLVHSEDRQVPVHAVYEGRGRHDANCADPCSCLPVVVAAHADHVGDGVLVPLGVQQEVASEVDCVYVRVCRTRGRPHRKAYWGDVHALHR